MNQSFPSLLHALYAHAETKSDRVVFTFLTDTGRQTHLTFGELRNRTADIAARLTGLQCRGERVLLLFTSEHAFVTGFYGCMAAGAIPVPVCPVNPNRPRLSLRALRHIAGDAAPLTVLGDTQSLTDLRSVIRGMDQNFQDLRIDRIAEDKSPSLGADVFMGAKLVNTDEIEENRESSGQFLPSAFPRADDLAYLQYTSGSVSQPKGVMVSHGNIIANLELGADIVGLDADEADTVAVGWVPLFHDLGLVCYVLGPVLFGYHSILMPPMLFMLRPVLWLQTIAKFRGTYSAAPNFAYELCIKLTKPEQKAGLDLSSWRVAGNGGELVRKSTLERFAAAFKNCGFHINAFYPTLGLAESVLFAAAAKDPGQPPVSLCLSRQSLEKNRVTFAAEDPDAAVREVVSCGRTGSHHEIAIVDPVNGRRCESGEPGEIWLRGPSIAQGYWNRAAESRQTFGGELADRSGQTFLRTGDMGFLYEGQLYIVGRYKEMIICRGKNIFPQDIETFAEESHPELRPGCSASFSVGAADEERIVFVAEVDPGKLAAGSRSLPELAKSVWEGIFRHHEIKPERVVLIKPATLPKTTSNKVQRGQCREQYLLNKLAILLCYPQDTTVVHGAGPTTQATLGRQHT